MVYVKDKKSIVTLLKWALCLFAAATPWFLPGPDGLSFSAWIYTGLFAAVLIGLLVEPIPPALVALLGVLTASLFRVGAAGSDTLSPFTGSVSDSLRWAFCGFSSPLVWLVFSISMLAKGFEKTGVGIRIGYMIIRHLGKSTLGLGYAVALTETILALLIPSATARSGGIVFSLAMGIPALCKSDPATFPRAVGAYLCWVGFASSCIASSLFLSAFIPNLIALDMLQLANIPTPDWLAWLMAMAPGGLLLLMATPLLAYWLYPPSQKQLDLFPHEDDGTVPRSRAHSMRQTGLLILSALMLVTWITGEPFGFSTSITALLFVCLLVMTHILDWNDVIGNTHAWNLVIWLGAMLSLSAGLDNMGVLAWYSSLNLAPLRFTPGIYLIVLVILFFFARYLLAGGCIYAASLLPLFLASGSEHIGMTTADAAQFGFLLAAGLGLSSVLTPYATGQGMIWLSAGYIRHGEFWFLGLLFGVIYLAIFLGIIIPWVCVSGLVSLF